MLLLRLRYIVLRIYPKTALGLFCVVSDEELFLSLGMLVNRQQYEQERYA